MTILSSLLLDGSPLNSSTDTLQSSSDGQVAVAIRGAVYIIVGRLTALAVIVPANALQDAEFP